MIVSDSDTWPLLPAGKCCGVYRFHPVRPTNHIIIATISGGCSVSFTVAILPLLGRCSTGFSCREIRGVAKIGDTKITGAVLYWLLMQGLTLSLFGRWLYWGFARPLIVSVLTHGHCFQLMKCCGVHCFHSARPTNHIIIAAILGGCSVSFTVAILPLLGRCSTSSSGLTLSLLPFGRLLCWRFARPLIVSDFDTLPLLWRCPASSSGLTLSLLPFGRLPCWGLSWAWLACWGFPLLGGWWN